MLTPPTAECCVPPPAVLEFDIEGNLLKSWGVPGSVPGWPGSEHTIFTDKEGNVWIGGATAGESLPQFMAGCKFVSRFGHPRPVLAGGENSPPKPNTPQTPPLFRAV